jgi:dihydroxyacetone kinase-like predicted kinase
MHEGGFGAIDASWLSATQQMHEHEGTTSGFCTEFVVSGAALDPDAMRAELQTMGESVLVVGGGDVARVHVHTAEPQRALAYARTLGELVHEKVDDMEAQFRALAAKRTGEAPAEGIAVVAVAAGDGLRDLLTSMGAIVVHGGPTMNPSAGDIRTAIEAAGARSVIVLPNDKNIVLAAKLAVDGLPHDVRVIETTSVPQGVAALVALNTEATLDENVGEMREAIGSVRTAEITLAARATKHSGLTIAEGQPIGIIDNELAVAEASIDEAARACVRRMLEGRAGAVVTLYTGDGQAADAAEALAASLREECGCDVEVIEGGQPHYPYLIGVE